LRLNLSFITIGCKKFRFLKITPLFSKGYRSLADFKKIQPFCENESVKNPQQASMAGESMLKAASPIEKS